jgi:hypothetical protein
MCGVQRAPLASIEVLFQPSSALLHTAVPNSASLRPFTRGLRTTKCSVRLFQALLDSSIASLLAASAQASAVESSKHLLST